MLDSKSDIMSLTPDCLAQLKLRQAPFEALPNQDFLYTDPLLDSLVETAVRALAAPGAITILAGVDGAGRSIQLMRLLGGLSEQFEIIAFRGRANIPFSAVEATIRSHLAAQGADDPSQPLREVLAQRGHSGMIAVLAIDDAHLIGMDIIDQLLRLRAEVLELSGQGLRLVLVGDPTLTRNRLPLPDPEDDNQIVRLNLRAFNLEQAGAYLRHRLRVAGIDDPDAFLSSGDIAALQSNGKGIPAALNAQANAWLIRRCLSANGVRQSIVGKISSLITPTASVSAEPPPLTPSRLVAVDIAPLPEPEPELPPTPRQREYRAAPPSPELSQFLVHEEKRADSTDFDRVLSQIRKTQLPPLTPLPPTAKAAPAPVPAAAALLGMVNRPWFIPAIVGVVLLAILVPVVLQLNDEPEPAPLLTDSAPARAEPVPPPLPERPEVPALPDVEALITAAVTPPPVPAPAEALPPPAARQPGTMVEPPPPPPIVAPPVTGAAAAIDFAADQDWLKRQDSNRFTVQLLAARNMSKVNEFMDANQVDGVHTIKTRSFYVIVIGSYPNRVAAEAAIRTLPAAVRVNGPWVRTIGSVTESLR
jgi:DamX protein